MNQPISDGHEGDPDGDLQVPGPRGRSEEAFGSDGDEPESSTLVDEDEPEDSAPVDRRVIPDGYELL